MHFEGVMVKKLEVKRGQPKEQEGGTERNLLQKMTFVCSCHFIRS